MYIPGGGMGVCVCVCRCSDRRRPRTMGKAATRLFVFPPRGLRDFVATKGGGERFFGSDGDRPAACHCRGGGGGGGRGSTD